MLPPMSQLFFFFQVLQLYSSIAAAHSNTGTHIKACFSRFVLIGSINSHLLEKYALRDKVTPKS